MMLPRRAGGFEGNPSPQPPPRNGEGEQKRFWPPSPFRGGAGGRGLFLALTLLCLAAGCSWPGKPDPKDRPVPPNKVLDFDKLFAKNCTACHGPDGKAGPAPPLNDPLFLAIVPDAELLRVIRDGRKGTLMPGFSEEQAGPLTLAQVKVLAEGIKPRWAQPGLDVHGVPPYLAPNGGPAGSTGNVERGKVAFARACAVCHGENGQGVPNDGQVTLQINDPAFLALLSDQALRRLVITGRPDLGMPTCFEPRPGEPNFKPLTPAEVSDLVAFLTAGAPGRSGRGKGNDNGGGQ